MLPADSTRLILSCTLVLVPAAAGCHAGRGEVGPTSEPEVDMLEAENEILRGEFFAVLVAYCEVYILLLFVCVEDFLFVTGSREVTELRA